MSVSPEQLALMTKMYEQAGGLKKQEIEQSFKLGKDQIANAMKIAQMDSKDKRFGIEVQREIGLANIAQAKLEMEQIGIPRVEIERWAAEKQYEMAQMELAFKREVQQQEYALASGELTGTFAGQPTLAAKKMEQDLGLAEGTLTGTYNGQPTMDAQKLAADRDQFAKTFGLSEAGVTGVYQGSETLAGRQQGLDEAERQRQYALQVAQLNQKLASTPDTYYQARNFQANDLPRLMGQMTPYGPSQTGNPTPGIARMGEFLNTGAGSQPYGTPYGGLAPTGASEGDAMLYGSGARQPGVAPAAATEGGYAVGGGGPVEGTRTQPQQDERARQIAQIAKAVPPSPYDGLNDQDAASLRLMESIYKKGGQSLPGGELERLNASGRIGFLRSAGNLLGYSPTELESTYQAYRPSQGAANLAG